MRQRAEPNPQGQLKQAEMRHEKRGNNKRGFAEGLFYSMSLKLHLFCLTFIQSHSYFFYTLLEYKTPTTSLAYIYLLRQCKKRYFGVICCNLSRVPPFSIPDLFAPSLHLTPVKLYQQANNQAGL